MTPPHSPYGPPPPGQQPATPPQNPYPQQQYPAQPYGYPAQQQYPAQPYGYPAQPYPAGTATNSPTPAYIIGGILSAMAMAVIIFTGLRVLALFPIGTLVGGILFILRVRFAPVVSIVAGTLGLLVILITLVPALIDDPSGLRYWLPYTFFTQAVLAIVVPLLPPARKAVRPVTAPHPPYRPY